MTSPLPPLLSVDEIRRRLEVIFPAGLDNRRAFVSEMAARVCHVFLYGGMVADRGRLLRPSHVYFFTMEQMDKVSDVEREMWFAQSLKPGFRPAGTRRWYADTTREPIRDETIRYGLLEIGAVERIAGVATTSSRPVYCLSADFALLLEPGLTAELFDAAVDNWQVRHLSPAARARMRLIAGGRTRRADDVLVACPDGSVLKLEPGPSSELAKAVVEQFAKDFLPSPALLWLSESGSKIRHADARLAATLGLDIDAATVLPDIILANVGASGLDTALVFVEVVATDGAMTPPRQRALLDYIRTSRFPAEQCHFVTAFEDRSAVATRKCLSEIAWGTFAWFRTEPQRLLCLTERPFDLPAKGRPWV